MSIKELSIDIGGRRLAAIDFGGKPEDRVVLAVHGWLDNAASFMELAPRLEGCRVIAVDLAGHGRSDWRDAGSWYAIWDYALDIHAMIDALDLHDVHLLGHSLGAAILSILAAVSGGRVRSLVMLEGLGPISLDDEAAPEQFVKALAWREVATAPSIYRDTERMVMARMKGRFPVGREAARHLISRSVRSVEGGYTWTHDPRLMAPSVMKLTEKQIEAFFRRIDLPVLVCLTERGIATDRTRARLDLLRNVQVVELPGGHHPHLEVESIAGVADAISAFYDEALYPRVAAEEARV